MALVRNPITGVLEENGLGLPGSAPIATPGYSPNPVVARAQGNTDAEAQAMAVHRQRILDANQQQPGVTSGYSENMYTANAQAAADARRQDEAVAAANVAPQVLGPRGQPTLQSIQGPAPTPLAGPRGLGVPQTPGATAGLGGPRGGGALLPTPDVPETAGLSYGLPGLATPTYPGAITQPTFPAPTALVPSAEDSSGNTLVAAPAAPAAPAPDYLAQVNQMLATNPPVPRARPGLVAGRTSFDQTNTRVGSGAPGGAGLNFGFGPPGSGNTARDVLDSYAASDRQSRLDQRAQGAVLEQRSLVAHLNDERDPIKRRDLRRQLDLGAAAEGQAAGLAQTNAGQTTAGRAQARAAQVQAASAQLNAQIAARSQLAQAEITGQYGLQGARIKAAGTVTAAGLTRQASSGTQRKANSEADLLDTRQAAIRAGVEKGIIDNAGVIAASKAGFEPRVPLPIDPNTNLPYTPEAYAALQQTATIQANRGLKAAQTR